MALPKRRHSNSRTGKRQAHRALTPPGLSTCPNCHEMKLPHRACPACGYYREKQVVEKEEA